MTTNGKKTIRGYLYVPETGAENAVALWVRSHATIAVARRVEAKDKRHPPTAAAVKKAAEGALPGLYRAKVRLDPNAWKLEDRLVVTRGSKVKAGVLAEITRLSGEARAMRETRRRITPREVREARIARATTDALRGLLQPAPVRSVRLASASAARVEAP